MDIEKLITVKGNGIFAIIGRGEIQSYPSYEEQYCNINQFPSQLSFITISDPNRENIDDKGYFKNSIKLKFWDLEEDFNQYKIITDKQGEELYNFIINNKDNLFLINCEAGISRSAGVGLAIEYLLRDLELYPKWDHFPSKVLQHWRYKPNMTVFNKIIQNIKEEK